jgi:hypothetical protein
LTVTRIASSQWLKAVQSCRAVLRHFPSLLQSALQALFKVMFTHFDYDPHESSTVILSSLANIPVNVRAATVLSNVTHHCVDILIQSDFLLEYTNMVSLATVFVCDMLRALLTNRLIHRF